MMPNISKSGMWSSNVGLKLVLVTCLWACLGVVTESNVDSIIDPDDFDHEPIEFRPFGGWQAAPDDAECVPDRYFCGMGDLLKWYEAHNSLKRKELVVYNHAEQSGSDGLVRVIDTLQSGNGIQASHLGKRYWGDPESYLEHWIQVIDSKMNTAAITNVNQVINAQVAWLNSTLHDTVSPVYITMLKDPVERCLSQFYFAISDDRPYPESRDKDRQNLENLIGLAPFNHETHTLTRCLEVPACREWVQNTAFLDGVRTLLPPGEPISFPIQPETLAKSVRILHEEYLVAFPAEEAVTGLMALQCFSHTKEQFATASPVLKRLKKSNPKILASLPDNRPKRSLENMDLIRQAVTDSGEMELHRQSYVKMCNMWDMSRIVCPHTVPHAQPYGCRDLGYM